MFKGITKVNFDAYLPEKWTSNVYNRERLEVKQHLLSLGDELNKFIISKGLSLDLLPSHEYPSIWNQKKVDAQWLFFLRKEQERKNLLLLLDKKSTIAQKIKDPSPFFKHVSLTVKLTFDQMEFGLKLYQNAWIDIKNLIFKWKIPSHQHKFVNLINTLPQDFKIKVKNKVYSDPSKIDRETIDFILNTSFKNAENLSIDLSLDRSSVINLGPKLVEESKKILEPLIPIYYFIAWSTKNDFIAVQKLLEKEEKLKSQQREEAKKKRELRPKLKIKEKKSHKLKPPLVLKKGMQVKITQGIFKGKIGRIAELENKEMVIVFLGTMKSRFSFRSLKPIFIKNKKNKK
jgi:transcription antitermination factor NusG